MRKFRIGDKVKFNALGKRDFFSGKIHPHLNQTWIIQKVSPDVVDVTSQNERYALDYMLSAYFDLLTPPKSRNLPEWW